MEEGVSVDAVGQAERVKLPSLGKSCWSSGGRCVSHKARVVCERRGVQGMGVSVVVRKPRGDEWHQWGLVQLKLGRGPGVSACRALLGGVHMDDTCQTANLQFSTVDNSTWSTARLSTPHILLPRCQRQHQRVSFGTTMTTRRPRKMIIQQRLDSCRRGWEGDY